MKKIFSIALAGVALMSIVACSEADYDEKYADPSKTSTVGVPQVFTAIQAKGNSWMNPVYLRGFVQTQTSGRFSGIAGCANEKGRWLGANSYFDTRWTNFYDMVSQYRLLEVNYEALAEDMKPANKVFYLLGRTMIEQQLHEMLSLFGDVPFTGAGRLWYTSDYAGAKEAVTYDDDVTLYKQILADLKETADYLVSGPDATGLASLKRQDISLAAGDATKWAKFTNSLRLRIALHLTNGDCASEAKAAIKEILENPTKYPVIEANEDNQGVSGDTQTDTFNYGKSWSQAIHTWGTFSMVGQSVLNALRINANGEADENSDPRVACLLDPNPDNKYIAYDVKKSSNELSDEGDAASKRYQNDGLTTYNYWAQVDSVAIQGKQEYQGNSKLGGVWMSAAEVALNKAEAYIMGYGVAKDEAKAKAAFVEGIKLSTEYYTNLKTSSNYYTPGTDDVAGANRTYVPATAADAEAYANAIWTPTQECVVTQTWLNHFIFNELEAWNIVRRTGYPVVEVATDAIQTSYPNPPGRLPYPPNEENYNTVNCDAAKATNYKEPTGYYNTLFWAKEKYYTVVANK